MLSKIIGGPYRVFSSRELCKLGYTERKRPENYERKLSIKIIVSLRNRKSKNISYTQLYSFIAYMPRMYNSLEYFSDY